MPRQVFLVVMDVKEEILLRCVDKIVNEVV